MIKGIWTEIRKINVFGLDFQFEKDFNTRFNSAAGFILSIIVFTATIVAAFILGEELIKKEKPKIIKSDTQITPLDSEISTSEFPYYVIFSTGDGVPILKHELAGYVEMNVKTIEVTKENGLVISNQKAVDCDMSKVVNEQARNSIISLMNVTSQYIPYCIDNNLKIRSKLANENSSVVELIFTRCTKNCAPDRDKILEGMLIGFTYVDSYISPSDFKNPIKYNSNMKTLMTSLQISKRIFFFFHKNIVKTNVGLIFEDYVTERYISFAGTENDNYFSENELMRILIESPTVVSINLREYLKLQELIANLGGFFNGILILTKLIFGDYLKFIYYKYIDSKTLISPKKKSSNELSKY